MKRVFVNSGLFITVFFWAALGASFAQDQQPTTASVNAPFAGATVSEWKGTIHLTLPGQSPSAPTQGETLPPGTVLETGGGQLLLQLVDGSQVLVRAHTRLTVQQPTPTDRGYFQLLLGRIRATITKRTGGAPPFELGTPSAVIGVRGTQFEVEVNKHQETIVDVFEGTVEVFGRHSRTSVSVEAGSSTRVGMDTPPEPPRPTAEMHSNAGGNRGNQGNSGFPGSNRAAQGAAHARGKP
ncbi:MAG: hypothetical protein DMG40_00860 [Acidobacteria bacterium]|nr:MAG: hypothetical protein DMG40_00860 [Acidobacteriota bacterium]